MIIVIYSEGEREAGSQASAHGAAPRLHPVCSQRGAPWSAGMALPSVLLTVYPDSSGQ